MYKKILTILFALLVTVALVAPANAAWREMWAYVYTWDGDMNAQGEMELTRLTSGVAFQVLQEDSDTLETLYEYNDPTNTSLTNPVTTTNFASNTVCNDMVAFKVDPGGSSDTDVDVIVNVAAGGFTAFVEDFDENTHTIVVDIRPNVMHHGIIWFGVSDNSATDTGINFLPDTAVHGVIVETVTADAGEDLDVGTEDTATGFAVAASVNAAGWVDPGEPTLSVGSNETYVSTAATIGSLLGVSVVGTDANEDTGIHVLFDHHVILAGTDDDLYYTGSAGSDTAVGYIHYFFTRLR